jgi:hypothetical protein
MIPHLHITRQPDLTKVPAIQEQFGRHGGRVVLFQRITSLIIVSEETSHLEWIPPYSTRTWVGLRYALWTALLGWWSISGLWCAPAAILTDIFGGVDVTELAKGPPPLPSHNRPQPIARAQAVFRNREYYVLIIELVLLVAGIILWIANTPTLPAPR